MHAIVHGCQWYSRWEASCSFAHSNGKQTYTLLRSLLVPAKPSDKSFQDIANTLKCHFDPKPLVIVERFYFHRQDQAEVESISDYLAELNCLATHCEFEQYLEQALWDRLVCGIRHENTQKWLLLEVNLTLTEAVDIVRSAEVAEKQSIQLKEKGSTSTGQVLKIYTLAQPKDWCDKQGVCICCGALGHQARDYYQEC